MSAAPRAIQTLTLSAYFSLIGILVIWYGYTAPAPIWLAIMLIPLAFPLRGLLGGRAYTYAWTSLLILAYFIHGVVEAWASPPTRLLASLEIIATVLVYLGTVMYPRAVKRAEKAQAGSKPDQH